MAIKEIKLNDEVLFLYYEDVFRCLNLIGMFKLQRNNRHFHISLSYIKSIQPEDIKLKTFNQMYLTEREWIARTLLERNFIIL